MFSQNALPYVVVIVMPIYRNHIWTVLKLCYCCCQKRKKGGGASLQEIDCVISHLWGLLNHKNNDITHKSDLRLCLPPSLPLVFSLRFTLGISCRQCCFGKKFNWYSSSRQHSHLLSNCFLTSTLHVSLHICLTLSLPSSKYAKYICSYLPVKGN